MNAKTLTALRKVLVIGSLALAWPLPSWRFCLLCLGGLLVDHLDVFAWAKGMRPATLFWRPERSTESESVSLPEKP